MSPSSVNKPSPVQQARERLIDAIYHLVSVRGPNAEAWLKVDAKMHRAISTFARAIRREERTR